ncbi:MAG TPA: anthranilate phosphoribosyltransferase [Candidatus Acidoferrum sp.]|nr:anthranilate phosphoribosyltransferase [Candidatus Acidoferrum sp.]
MTHALLEFATDGNELDGARAEELMEDVLAGRLQTPEIVRLLTALNARAYRAEEMAGFARAMRRHATPVFAENDALPERMVDTCGTGGDDSGTFNISTAAAIVAAAAGARVAKHGNRAASSKCGSADVLEALGVAIDLPFARIGQGIREISIGFLFAQVAHTAARFAMPARKQMGVRTVFNLLGPLTNPARAQAQVIGVFSAGVVDVVAGTLAELDTEHALVVHGAGQLDEISLAGPTMVAEVRNRTVTKYQVTPEDFGKRTTPVAAAGGSSIAQNAELIRELFATPTICDEQRGARHDIVVINAAAALVVAGVAEDFRNGAELAERAIRDGAAREKLEQLRAFRGA